MNFFFRSIIQSEINPWDDKFRQKIMLTHPVYPTYLHDCNTRMKRINAGTSVVFEGEQFNILELIGEGGFAKVFRSVSEDGNTYAIKVENPSCRWEVYVCELLRTRLPHWVMTGVMSVNDAYIYSNMSAIVYEYHPFGNILDLANSMKSVRCSSTGLLCVYLSLQMARILNEVHKAHIIHADVKPDNFMILKKLDENSSVEELLDEKNFTIKLIDWGRAIDMSAAKNRTFTGKAGTEFFDCFEMLDGRPWTYQVDFFGFIATMHVILFGSYMKTMRDEATNKRWSQRDVLQDVFQMCMNIPDCDSLPDWDTIISGLMESVRYTLTSDIMQWKNCVRDFNQAISSRVKRR
uniref:Protein kinase domain-containing protein n=1 Tax=Syphacia muris TaxID=451379 RepID=A0A158R511_9BILA